MLKSPETEKTGFWRTDSSSPYEQGNTKFCLFFFPSKDCSQNSSLSPSVEGTLVQASCPSFIHTFISQSIQGQRVCCSPSIQVLAPAHTDSYLMGKPFSQSLVQDEPRVLRYGICKLRAGLLLWLLDSFSSSARCTVSSREQLGKKGSHSWGVWVRELGTGQSKRTQPLLSERSISQRIWKVRKKWEEKTSSLLLQR